LRIKEQEKRLTLNEHDDDDYDLCSFGGEHMKMVSHLYLSFGGRRG